MWNLTWQGMDYGDLYCVSVAKLELYFLEFPSTIKSEITWIVRDFSHQIGKAEVKE